MAKTIADLEIYAKENHIPIARKSFVDYLTQLVLENHYTTMLEIGTGIAYTCICLCQQTNLDITTIEYRLERYQESKKNVQEFEFLDRIHLYYGDALSMSFSQKYDIIFIDEKKKKNKAFFIKYSPLLSLNGTLIIDNMDLRDFALTAKKEKVEKYTKNNQELMDYLFHLKDFEVTYLPIGDGILKITHKK